MIANQDLLTLSRRELMERMHAGHPIDPEALSDSCYRGISLGLPAWVDRLSWKTFMKSFWRDPLSGRLFGWNTRLAQDGLNARARPLQSRRGGDRNFGPFEVHLASHHPVPSPLRQGLLIHYGHGPGATLSPLRLLRDPVVALEPGSCERLLGWSYLQLGLRVHTPSFFLLERISETIELVPPWLRQASRPLLQSSP
jgi:hypothetical protein